MSNFSKVKIQFNEEYAGITSVSYTHLEIQPNEWTITLNVSTLEFPLRYKFVTCNADSKQVEEWELSLIHIFAEVSDAGPAKTPQGMACGSMGPTTAGRMDPYVDLFQGHGGSMIMLAKGAGI